MLPDVEREVIAYALWIDQRYSHRFLGLGPTAWENALVALDARGSDREIETDFEVDKTEHVPRKQVLEHMVFGPYYDTYELTDEVTEAGEKVYLASYDDDVEEWQQPRRVTEKQMLEEKRVVRRGVAQRRKKHYLYRPVSDHEWYGRGGSSVNLTSFDSILKSIYTEDAIKKHNEQPSPLLALMKKAPKQANTMYVNPQTYEDLMKIIGGS